MNKILQGDCIEKMKKLEDNSVDAIVTDPPYGLEFMGKDWDKGVPGKHFWEEMLRVLKPGGFLLSFAGTRTYHRMGVNIEDAGFEIRDTIMWLYGSGFPKSLNIGKQIDKIQGNEREVVPNPKIKQQTQSKDGIYGDYEATTHITKGNSEWEGWGTALKPACEPIVVARKPLSEKNHALNVLKWGTGGINIDACRIGLNGETQPTGSGKPSKEFERNAIMPGRAGGNGGNITSTQGRFPANIILDKEAGKILDEQTGDLGKSQGGRANQTTSDKYGKYANKIEKRDPGFGDNGGASRFFKSIKQCQHLNKELEIDEKRFFCSDCQKWINCDDLEDSSRFFYCAKASKSERNLGCEDLDEQKQDLSRKEGNPGGDNPRNRGVHLRKNNHPTVKPIKLMEYLIKLVSKEGAVVLDPFMGSGTTLIACAKLNRNGIGIEKEDDYIKIAKARIKPFLEQTQLLSQENK